MKKLLAVVFLVAVTVLAYTILFGPSSELSQTQKDTVEYLGYPDQFALAYIPTTNVDEEPSLTRTEVWYYYRPQIKIIFFAGEVFETAELPVLDMEDLPSTKLKPEDFTYDQNKNQVKRNLDDKDLVIMDYFEDLFVEDEYETYATSQAEFVIEQGKLTYFQTLGIINEE